MSESLDLTPRPAAPPADASRRRRWRTWFIFGVIAVGGGFLLYQMLTQATVYFYNVDQAVAKRAEIGDRRVRVQGHVVDGTVEPVGDGVSFTLRFDGESLDVVSTSPPPDLFEPDIPVVVEGVFVGDEFRSDEILVMHDSTYEEDNGDRIKEAEDDITRSSTTP